MSLSVEREFQLQAAIHVAGDMDAAQLRQALLHAWRTWLVERQTNEELLRAALGLDVTIGGPLLPPTLRAAAG